MHLINKKNIIIGTLIGIIIVVVVFLILNIKPGKFDILNFNQDIKAGTVNLLTWSESKSAVKYDVIIYKNNNEVIKAITTNKNFLVINDLDITFDDTVIIDVIAHNKKGNKRKANSSISYNWELPIVKISEPNMYILNDNDVTNININILDNNIDTKGYYYVINKDNKDIFSNSVDDDFIVIDSSFLKQLDSSLGKYDILLCTDYQNERVIISKTTLNILLEPITEITINKPINSSEVPFDDLLIEFTGGKNAKDYYFTLLYNDNIIVTDNISTKGEINLSVDNLNPNTEYTLIVGGIHQSDASIKKETKINFSVTSLNKVSRPISTKDSGVIGVNRAIRLSTNTIDADIYYTTDGTEPNNNSNLYNGSIYIDKNMTIKAIAIKEEMNPSDIVEFNYQVEEKPIAIYLSPSVQTENKGIALSGYTNEMDMMNKVGNYIEARLKEKGIVVYRNNPNMTLSQIVVDSSKHDVDMHLAIHSNLFDGKNKGVETWVHDENQKTAIDIANIIQSELMNIYYDKKGDRGVRYSTSLGGMRETNPKNVTNGVLVEIAFHDHMDDALWIVKNQMQIGYTIADAVASYYEK
jgi:N-acetylmuramoyl-L-alanine amidase